MEEAKVVKVSLLMEGYPRNGFKVFSNHLGNDQGVCITRLHPDYVVEKFGLRNSRFHWLSGVKQQGTLSPKNVNALVRQVRSEIREGRRKFFLDGLEYLLLWNDMNSIVSSLKEIERDLERAEGSMMVSIDPLTFEEKDLRKLLESFPKLDVDLSAVSQQTCADAPIDKDRIGVDQPVSKVLTATP